MKKLLLVGAVAAALGFFVVTPSFTLSKQAADTPITGFSVHPNVDEPISGYSITPHVK
ncbi:MAG: hypothetical protein ABF586_05050 [Sporolactobacillus sp.]